MELTRIIRAFSHKVEKLAHEQGEDARFEFSKSSRETKCPAIPGFFRVFFFSFFFPRRNLFFHDGSLSETHSDRTRARADGYAKHCNSCLLIISASISRSKPPANADRTLSLSRSPHFVPPPLSPSLHTPPLHPLYICTRPTSSDTPISLLSSPLLPSGIAPSSQAGSAPAFHPISTSTSCRYDQ